MSLFFRESLQDRKTGFKKGSVFSLVLSSILLSNFSMAIESLDVKCKSGEFGHYVIRAKLEKKESCILTITSFLLSEAPQVRTSPPLDRSNFPLEFFHANRVGESINVLAACEGATESESVASGFREFDESCVE